METPECEPSTSRLSLSRHPATAWMMLAIAAPVGGWFLHEIHRTIGLNSPRIWELLRTDRVFDIAMLDFMLTAGWAFLVLIDRSGWKDWRLWVTMPIFFAIPTLGIIMLAHDGFRGGANNWAIRAPNSRLPLARTL